MAPLSWLGHLEKPLAGLDGDRNSQTMRTCGWHPAPVTGIARSPAKAGSGGTGAGVQRGRAGQRRAGDKDEGRRPSRGLKGPGGAADGEGAASTGPVTTASTGPVTAFYERRGTQAGAEMARPGVLVLGRYRQVTWHHAEARGSALPGFRHRSPLIRSVT